MALPIDPRKYGYPCPPSQTNIRKEPPPTIYLCDPLPPIHIPAPERIRKEPPPPIYLCNPLPPIRIPAPIRIRKELTPTTSTQNTSIDASTQIVRLNQILTLEQLDMSQINKNYSSHIPTHIIKPLNNIHNMCEDSNTEEGDI